MAKADSHTSRIQRFYDRNAEASAEAYNSLDPANVHAAFTPHIPKLKALDLGCGTGRDAVWLAEQGFQVDAADFSEASLKEAEAYRDTQSETIQQHVSFYKDALPSIANTQERASKQGGYDVILLSAVWMHLTPEQQAEALPHILKVANPGATICISLRHGTSPEERPMFEVSADALLKQAALELTHADHLPATKDVMGRGDVWWDYVTLYKPKEHLQGLEDIRREVINGAKSSTYKPAFMLALAHAMQQAESELTPADAARMALPLTHVERVWHDMFRYAADHSVPQHHSNTTADTALRYAHEEPAAQERRFAAMLKKGGPLQHIQAESGHPLFTVEQNAKDGLDLVMPNHMARTLQAEQPLICKGMGEVVRRFVEKKAGEAPAERFTDRILNGGGRGLAA